MKIVFNTDQIHLHGGIEKVLATKANYFAALPNVEVIIVTTEQQDLPPRYCLDPRITWIDLRVNYDRTKSYFSLTNFRKAVKHFRKQKALFKTLKPDAIISPNFNFDHYWLPFIKGHSLLIKERHNSRFFEEKARNTASFLNKIKYQLLDWTEEQYDHIVVLNKDEASYVKTQNAVVIPNPIETSNLCADINQKQVIAAGRISPVKNFGDLIKAWQQVKEEFPDWQLHIYGDDYGGTKAILAAEVMQKKMENNIHFKGSVSNMPEVMTEYSIYAMSSQTECFPMVLLEAMSVGLPIISYDCPNGPRNIIDNGEDGYLVRHNNVENLAAQLKNLMRNTNERERLKANAKKNVEQFSTKVVMKQWEDLLNLPNV